MLIQLSVAILWIFGTICVFSELGIEIGCTHITYDEKSAPPIMRGRVRIMLCSGERNGLMAERIHLSIFSIVALALFSVACRGDDDSSKEVGCQSCLDRYCDCADGVTDPQALSDCAESASSCTNNRCTSAEAQSLDYTTCGVGSSDNTEGGDCQGCIDDFCGCIDGVTDTDVLTNCSTTMNECISTTCTEAETQNLDLSSCQIGGDDLEICQACTDAYCICLESGGIACDSTYTSCVEVACDADLISQVDFSCLTETQL
jgi:hypothetical protein